MCVPFRGALYWGPLRSVARETPAASPPAKLENKRPRPDRPVCPLHDDVWRYAVSLPSLSFSCALPLSCLQAGAWPWPWHWCLTCRNGQMYLCTFSLLFSQWSTNGCSAASSFFFDFFCFWMQPLWLCLSPWTPPCFSLLTSLCPTVLNVGPVFNCVKTKALDGALWSWLWGVVWKLFRLFFGRGDQIFGEEM